MRKISLLLLLTGLCAAQVSIGSSSIIGGPVITSGVPPNCFVGVPYTYSAAATGGTLPYAWSTNPSTPVPGLGIINASSGVLGGNGLACTTPGTYAFQLTVTDAAGNATSQPFSITAINALQISPVANPVGEVGFTYTSATPVATGGAPPYQWLCPSCTYPGGLGPINSLTGVIAGTATTQGTFPLLLQVKDSANNTATASAPITILPAVSITSGAPPTPATQNVVYPTFAVVATGGTLPYTYSLAFGSSALPTGLSLNGSTGAVTGTPTVLGTTTNIIFQVTDSHNPNHSTATSGPFTIVVAAAPPALQFTNSPCGSGTQNSVYNCQLTASGGTGLGYAFTLFSGSNPPNTSLNGSTGLITGTPLSSGTFTPTYRVTDSGAHTANQAENITINPATGCGPTKYLCASTSTAVIQAPPPPFTTNVGRNQISCDTSINGACTGLTSTEPIARATDSTESTGSGTFLTGFTIDPTSGAGENIFAVDDSKIMLIPQNTGAGCVKGFTPSTMQFTTTCIPVPNSHTVVWSRINPNLLYSLNNGGTGNPSPKIWGTTFTSPTVFTQAVVVDPLVSCSALIPAGTYTAGAISVSFDDNIVYGVLLTTVQGSPGYVFAFNQSTQQCSALYTGAASNLNNILLFNGTLANATLPCTPLGLHNSNTFLNGIYSRITTGPTTACPSPTWPQPLIWQEGTTNVYSCGVGEQSGHNANGYNLEVVISNPNFFSSNVTQSSANYCAGLNTNSFGAALGCSNGQCTTNDIENHFGLNRISAAETEPVIVGTACANCATTTVVAPTVNELWGFQRSPAFLIQRFTHMWNSSSVNCPTCDFRVINGIVTQSQTGKFAAFASDMNLSLGTSSNGTRIDVFVVRLD